MIATAQRRLNRATVAIPFAWLILFAALPLLIVLKISLADMRIGAPPYTDLVTVNAAGDVSMQATAKNFQAIAGDALYWRAYLSSVRIAAISTLLALLLGFPMAYAIARADRRWRGALLLAVMLPFWTSFLIRIYALIGLIRPGGLVSQGLEALGLIAGPLRILNTEIAVYLGMVFCYLPYMVLPLYARLERLDPALLEAAADLGAGPTKTFFRITLPLAAPGILAGCLLVFIPAVGEFVIPELLGGADTLMIGRVMWNEFFTNRDWPLSAAVSIVLLAV
ncbi:MAG: ABC transporter permease subunit, partial [Alphaproteobacteria bacterium]|nr:ABC transporter permease subunit [Alphaproteobacteria bacterium]